MRSERPADEAAILNAAVFPTDAEARLVDHPDYYPRHGFAPARTRVLRWAHGHEDAFFVQAISPGGLDGVSGVVRYRPMFDAS